MNGIFHHSIIWFMGNKTQSRSKIRFGINSPITELFQENFAETSSSKTQKDFHHHLKANMAWEEKYS